MKPTWVETDVLRQLLVRLSQIAGVHAWRSNAGKVRMGRRWVAFGTPGQGDITGIIMGGRRLEIEAKRTPREKQSSEQVEFQCTILGLGGLYLLCHGPDDIDRVIKCVTSCVVAYDDIDFQERNKK